MPLLVELPGVWSCLLDSMGNGGNRKIILQEGKDDRNGAGMCLPGSKKSCKEKVKNPGLAARALRAGFGKAKGALALEPQGLSGQMGSFCNYGCARGAIRWLEQRVGENPALLQLLYIIAEEGSFTKRRERHWLAQGDAAVEHTLVLAQVWVLDGIGRSHFSIIKSS